MSAFERFRFLLYEITSCKAETIIKTYKTIVKVMKNKNILLNDWGRLRVRFLKLFVIFKTSKGKNTATIVYAVHCNVRSFLLLYIIISSKSFYISQMLKNRLRTSRSKKLWEALFSDLLVRPMFVI